MHMLKKHYNTQGFYDDNISTSEAKEIVPPTTKTLKGECNVSNRTSDNY